MVADNITPGDSLKVLSTPDLYDLSVKLAEEYNRQSSGAFIKVVKVSDPGKAVNLLGEGNLGIFSGDFYSELKNESLWKIVIGRDIIVPVINTKNPFIQEICKNGISGERLAGFVSRESCRNWGYLLRNEREEKAGLYCIDGESAIIDLAGFLKIDRYAIPGKSTVKAEDVLQAVQKDTYAIGICKLVNVIDSKNLSLADNIRLLPIDRNGNGVIDYNEKIYDNINDFTRGVWIGKYPKSLFSSIYSVSKDQPENSSGIAFLKWVLSDGQKLMQGYGYSDLLVSERQSACDKLYTTKIDGAVVSGEKSLFKAFLFVIAAIILAGLLLTLAVRRKKTGVKVTSSVVHSVLHENSLKIPKGIYFDKTHTWAFLEQNGTVRIGIDDFLQHITGKITRIKMKGSGKKFQKGDQILSVVQNGKQLNLYAPVSGTIIEQNTALETSSYIINSSPYNDGWVYLIEPSNWSRESQLLFMADRHREFIKKEFSRLKDFLVNTLGPDSESYSQVIMQDGGEINDGALSELGPEGWEDFQTNFIDPSRQLWFYEIF